MNKYQSRRSLMGNSPNRKHPRYKRTCWVGGESGFWLTYRTYDHRIVSRSNMLFLVPYDLKFDYGYVLIKPEDFNEISRAEMDIGFKE